MPRARNAERRLVRCAARVGVALAAFSRAASAAAIPASDLMPLQPGDSWTYVNDVPETGTMAVLEALVPVNGVEARSLDSSGPHVLGATEWFTNDASGLRVHGASIEFGFQTPFLVLSPALVLVPAIGTPGTATPSTGTATVQLQDQSYPVTYTATAALVGMEAVTVPAGSFSAARIDLDFAANGTVLGQPLSLAVTETFWFAPGVGLVMDEVTSATPAASARLVPRLAANTNVNVPTHPGPWRLQSYHLEVPVPSAAVWTGVAGVAALAAARRVRRRR